ncbi:MAG TPA: nuclear transport factor 2 family protein [Kofleriaceae bacterium]|nr:nuclear transport factor 2 family protein [Kofleriaceae bacterium]
MRRLLLSIAAATAAVTSACATRDAAPAAPAPAPAARRFVPADRTAITAVLDAQVAAWNRGDLAAYMDGYARTDDLIFTSGGKVRRGWQTTFDQYRKRYAQDPAAMGKLVFEIDRIDPVGADAAIVLGAWILTGSPHDGRGIFSLVLERRPEGWRIVHDHTSLATP